MVISLPGFFVGLLDVIIRVASIGIVFFHILGMFLEVSVFGAITFDAKKLAIWAFLDAVLGMT